MTVKNNISRIHDGPLDSQSMALFGERLALAIPRAKLNITKMAERVNTSHSMISQVISGKNTPPLEKMDAWATALGLEDQERTEFIDLAAIAHIDEPARSRIESVYLEHVAQGQELTTMRAEIAELRAIVDELQREKRTTKR